MSSPSDQCAQRNFFLLMMEKILVRASSVEGWNRSECAIYAQSLSVQIRLNDGNQLFGDCSLLASGQRASSEDDLRRSSGKEAWGDETALIGRVRGVIGKEWPQRRNNFDAHVPAQHF